MDGWMDGWATRETYMRDTEKESRDRQKDGKKQKPVYKTSY